MVKLHTKDEAMMVHAFRRGVLAGPFSDSLIRCRPEDFLRDPPPNCGPHRSRRGGDKSVEVLARLDLGELVVLNP